MTEHFPWWDRDRHADRRPLLRQRARLTTAVRRWFEDRDFTEAETAILQVSPGNEVHLHALATSVRGTGGLPRTMHLHTSPEFAMKKLLAAGERQLFTLARCFRDGESGPLHHPEFTMLEWYRAEAPYAQLIEDCAALLRLAAEVGGAETWTWRGRAADPRAEPERLAVADAFACHASVDLGTTLGGAVPDRDGLAAQAERAGVRVAADDDWSDVFSRVLVERVEPHLGLGRPTVLDRYPAPEAALARPCADDPRFAERFELYVCGVELANGFGELTDAAEQRRRFETAMAERDRRYGAPYPLDEDFLAALARMPPASGIALGFDRLAMLATGATRIDQALWTPVAGA